VSRIQGSGRDGERQLVRYYRSLAPADQDTLLTFSEFLASQGIGHQQQEASAPREPVSIPRPQEESVVGAIKRLSRKFYMLDRSTMLNDTSSLMGVHVLQGRPAGEVIDELEDLFARHYTEYRAEQARKEA